MAHLKNLFTGSWSYGSYRNDGVWIPTSSPENPSNNIGETEYIKIDPNKSATLSWAGWSKSIPSNVTIHSYHTNSDLTSYAKATIDSLSQTAVNNSITFENADEADYIRFYFHGSGSATQYQPLGFQITQAGVFDDVAFKVIVKNDGISDVIFKTMMLKGEAGGTIASIEKTSTSGVVDTYTITLNDGTTTTFEVTNGSNIQSIEKTATAGLIDTYTVTLTNGDTSTFEVKNGEDAQLYELPQNCVVGYDHEPTQVTETSYERYISLDNVNGISSVKYNGNTLQETNDGRNLFNKDDASIILSGYINNDIYYSHANSSTICLPVEPSTTYTVSKISSKRFRLASCATIPSNNNSVNNYMADDTATSITITTGASDHYLLAFVFNTTEDSPKTLDDILATVQIEKNSQATPYQPYCGGIPAPNPSYPKEIVGVGDKQSNNTYSVDLVAEDADGNVYTVTASGLTHPVYAGDWIDLVAGVLHRGNGCVDMGDLNYTMYTVSNGNAFVVTLPNGKVIQNTYNSGIKCTSYSEDTSVNNAYYIKNISCKYGGSYFGTTKFTAVDSNYNNASDFKTAMDGQFIVYPLETATEEDITLTGDLEQVKRIRGEYAYIDAPLRTGSTEITFGQETDFPDGYEEIDFPLDDMFYYQDGEYVDFPKNWGFVMGYVFDANTIRFVMNVTKQLKEGMSVDITRSADLSLNTYAGAGDVGILSGFSGNAVSWIPELGQIQISLTTESPHGLTPNMLLGARVATGTLRIYFVED